MSVQSNPLNQHWTDILALSPPQSNAVWLVLSSVVLLALVVFVVYVLWQQQPRRRALRVVRRCGRQLQSAPGEARRIAHTLHHTLLQGLGLHPATVMHGTLRHNPQWRDFYRRLQQCAFQATPPATDELAGLIQQACDWLRQGNVK